MYLGKALTGRASVGLILSWPAFYSNLDFENVGAHKLAGKAAWARQSKPPHFPSQPNDRCWILKHLLK